MNVLGAPDSERCEIEAERASRRLNVVGLQHGIRIASVEHDCHSAELRDDLAQEFEPLGDKIGLLNRHSGNVAARSRETRNQAAADWVDRHGKDDGGDRRCLL